MRLRRRGFPRSGGSASSSGLGWTNVQMQKPVATYRVQLNDEFTFNDLEAVLPYLSDLGISHIYASPIFKCRKGSKHGYDILDSNRISEQLGGRRAFEKVHKEACVLGLGWIQDIVPNHVAYDPENPMVSDAMRQGAASRFHRFLDVDWNHPSAKLKGRILAPFLEDDYLKCLNRGDIKLVYHNGFAARYKDKEFPVNAQTLDLKGSSGEIEQTLQSYNSNPERLDRLLSAQAFTLAHWKKAFKQINYRRFFDIADLICLRTEDPTVFEATHQLVFDLLSEKLVDGVRVDHVDGLREPQEYLERLRRRAPDAFVVVEKILTGDEELRCEWPVQGTTGYEFLNRLNGVFIDPEGRVEMDRLYGQFTGCTETFSEILLRCKRQVIRELFWGDVGNLARMLQQTLSKQLDGKRFSRVELRHAVAELLADFPVYRSYLTAQSPIEETVGYLREALEKAKKNLGTAAEALSIIEKVLGEDDLSMDALQFVMRLQQFTGAVMAKGLEDTAFYVYNRLLSLNEVGGSPAKFGVDTKKFHAFNAARQASWSLSLNATSTHDTKRGEDARARLDVLSEMPREFGEHLQKWADLNADKKRKVNGRVAPERNEEYYLYQTLLGAFPFKMHEVPQLSQRLSAHVVKALREAKIYSSWLNPRTTYENAVAEFATDLLNPQTAEAFLEDFLPFQRKIAFYGVLNSLSQTLLKTTSPGIPDFYQGTELWSLSTVDPDNRGSVDFRLRQAMLSDVSDAKLLAWAEFLRHPEDGKVKLCLIFKALEFRKKHKTLFEEGAYIPLEVHGARQKHIIAFCRRKENQFAISIASRFFTDMIKAEKGYEPEWKSTCICLPADAPANWTDWLTGENCTSEMRGEKRLLRVGSVLKSLPVALLTGDRDA